MDDFELTIRETKLRCLVVKNLTSPRKADGPKGMKGPGQGPKKPLQASWGPGWPRPLPLLLSKLRPLDFPRDCFGQVQDKLHLLGQISPGLAIHDSTRLNFFEELL